MAKYIGNVYQGKTGDWHWRLTAKNGNVVANGGEGYKNRNVAQKMMENVTSLNSEFDVTLDPTEAEQAKAQAKLDKLSKGK